MWVINGKADDPISEGFPRSTLGKKSLTAAGKGGLLTLSLYAAVITLPWSVKINGFLLISAMVFGVFYVKHAEWKTLSPNAQAYLAACALYFLLHSISLFYTENTREGIKDLDQKWSFAILPIGVMIATRLNLERKRVLQYFYYSILVASVLALIVAVINNYNYNQEHALDLLYFNHWFYSYRLLSLNIGIHPAYLSNYISLVIFYLIYQLISERQSRKKSFLTACLVVYFLLYLILLSSRNVLVTTLIIILFAGIIYSLYTKNIRLILAGLSVYIVLFLAILSNDITRGRIIEIFDIGKTDSQWGNISLRFKEWDASTQIIKENLFFGVGSGDFRGALIAQYNAKGWTDMAEQRFNSHNQFIETTGRLGVLGLMVLISIFFFSVREAFLKRDLLHFVFLASFIMFSLTESTLEVQKGIVFFTLFNSVFFFSKSKFDQETLLAPKTFVRQF